MPATLLIIDDEESICFAFRRFFQKRGFSVLTTGEPQEACRLARESQPALVFLDVNLGGQDGLELLPLLKQAVPQTCIVVITAFGSLEIVRRAFDAGASEYLTKPIDMNTAERLVKRATMEITAMESAPRPEAGYVGSSAVMQELFMKLLKIASQDEPVLICGPTGTGKELAAKLIHQKSARSSGPFIPVNCGAIPENLMESELFGHCKGAFTGAVNDRTGYCQAANHGVLFLDEIGELSLQGQVKLLRFLDSKMVEKLGAVSAEPVDVRVIAATNVNLETAVARGAFREDLYYRLAVLSVKTPALEHHLDDIPELASHFLHEVNPTLIMADETVEQLKKRKWPGNVRQLRNVVIQAALSAVSGIVTPDCLPEGKEGLKASDGDPLQAYVDGLHLDGATMHDAIARLQRLLIQKALKDADGNQSLAAERLGIHRNSIRRLLTDS